MKKSTLWILSAVALAALLAGGARWASQRQASKAPAAPTAAVVPSIELATSDVFTARTQTLNLGIAVSGALKASESAIVKARVAGELQELSVREGDRVQAGQVIARIEPIEYQARVRQAQQQADAAKAQVDIAQRQFDNNQALVNQGFISQTALLTSQASLNGATATHAAALAALDLANKSLADATLRSPLSGVVAQRLAQPGERVAIEARLVEVINLSQLELEAALTAEDASLVRVGMTAQLQVDGVDAPISAKVLRINPSAQIGSRSILVYLGIKGREGLRQGQFAQGSLGTQTLQVIAVPVDSVRTDKPQPYVQVVQDGKVAHITVRTDVRSEGERQTRVAVTGVSEGAQVLSDTASEAQVQFGKLEAAANAELKAKGVSAKANRVASLRDALFSEIDNPVNCGQGPEAQRLMDELKRELPEFKPLSSPTKNCTQNEKIISDYKGRIDNLVARAPWNNADLSNVSTKASKAREELADLRSEISKSYSPNSIRQIASVFEGHQTNYQDLIFQLGKQTDTDKLEPDLSIVAAQSLGNVYKLPALFLSRLDEASTYVYLLMALCFDLFLVYLYGLAKKNRVRKRAIAGPLAGAW